MSSKTSLSITWKQPDVMAGDCRLGVFSIALSYAKVLDISPAELFGFGCGLSFILQKITLSDHLSLIGFAGRDLNTELYFCLKNNIHIKTIQSKQPSSITHVDKDILNELSFGRPIMANVDRYYLDYLKYEKAHFGWHLVLVVGCDQRESSLDIIDYVVNGTQTISAEAFNKSHFKELAYTAPAGKKYIIYEQQRRISSFGAVGFNAAFKTQSEKMLGENGSVNALLHFSRFLSKTARKAVVNKGARNFLKYQVPFIYKTVREQEYTSSMYRALYLEFIKKCMSDYSANNFEDDVISLFNYDVQLWKRLATSEGKTGDNDYIYQANAIAALIEEIANIEEKLFNHIKEISWR